MVRLACLVPLLTATLAAAAPAAESEHVIARLVAEDRQVAPGATFHVAVDFQVEAGWHLYWRSSGDGVAPTVKWSAQEGFSAGPLEWPMPEAIANAYGGGITYGYRDAVLLPLTITVAPSISANTVVIAPELDWIVCGVGCFPGKTALSLALPVAAQPLADPVAQSRIGATLRTLPTAPPAGFRAAAVASDDGYAVTLTGLPARSTAIRVLPTDEAVDYVAPQKVVTRGDAWSLTLPRAARHPALATHFGALVAFTTEAGATRAYEVDIAVGAASAGGHGDGPVAATRPGDAPASEAALAAAAPTKATPAVPSRLVPILLALVGGLLLGLGLASRLRSRSARTALVAVGLGLGAVVATTLALTPRAATAPAQTSAGLVWDQFSPEKIAAYRAQGRPVFVDFTAAWCVTCQRNEVVLFHSDAVQRKLRDLNVALLKADWTDQDPLITQALSAFGRSGVPFYVLYPRGAEAPATTLPEPVDPGGVLAALEQLR